MFEMILLIVEFVLLVFIVLQLAAVLYAQKTLLDCQAAIIEALKMFGELFRVQEEINRSIATALEEDELVDMSIADSDEGFYN